MTERNRVPRAVRIRQLLPIAGVLSLAALTALPVAAEGVRDTRISGSAERHIPSDAPMMTWSYADPAAPSAPQGDQLETVEVDKVAPNTVKLTGVVPPIYFPSGVAEIPERTVVELRKVLNDMRDRVNVRLNLVGHADTQALSPALTDVYGDNFGLSRERAGQVAEHFKVALGLPAEAISFEWMGDTRPVADNATEAGRARNRRVEVEVWYDELEDGVALEERVVTNEFARVPVCRVETVCKLRYLEGHDHRARVFNLVTPLHYTEEAAEITAAFSEQIARTLANLSDRQNVVVKFIGYTDNTPLSERTARIYGDHDGLSKARARRVALAVQDRLGLATAAVESDGRGASRPLASNDTPAGRKLNRRVEVEFWYDDPLQDLPDEPQLCPGDAGAEMVTRVYDPPWGQIADLTLDRGTAVVPAGYLDVLGRAMADVADKDNVRLRFVGYTRNEGLDRRTAEIYGDDIGLSAARARRAMETIAGTLGLTEAQREFEGRGYVHSSDVVNAGFTQGDTSYVAVQVVYDELAALDDNEGLDITPLRREITPKNPFALNLMRITVDGEPIDDPSRSSADVQRCTDVAMQGADIRFGFDNLASSPRLSVASSAAAIPVHDDFPGGVTGDPVRFRMYANYGHFIDRAEIRIFDEGQSVQATPQHIVEVDEFGHAQWTPRAGDFAAPSRKLSYVLRAYDAGGSFDETVAQPLWLVHDGDWQPVDEFVPESEIPPQPVVAPASTTAIAEQQLLAAYGENALTMHNIGLSSGTVRVHGSDIPDGYNVYVAGRPVPVDAGGSFVSEEILPEGAHSVEVAILNDGGAGESYRRDLEFKNNDWFYAGIADLTLSLNDTSGPMKELAGENPLYDYDSSADGRLAFYANGKFGEKWRLTASADTREEPIENLFTNFMSKSPDSLLRRIDADYYYPTFGDDSVVEETAPTLGKFFVKLSRGGSYGMWGNFKVGYVANELAQVDRGLYGANVHYETPAATSFGERRFVVDAFGAEPGTIASREEFRGTGGSLYFMRHQDVLVGSERVRIEVRDRASGLVTGVLNLSPELDYDIDYLQGTILLTTPLASTANDQLMVRSGAIGGDETYLVVRYEYSPGFAEIDALSAGTQMHAWLTDYLRVGLTASTNDEGDTDSALNGVDVTLRKSANSWFKVQASSSEGLVSQTLRSDDGGFAFQGDDVSGFGDADASAYRADLSVGLEDVMSNLRGRMTLYTQELDAGYSAPGLVTNNGAQHYGGTFSMPVTTRLEVTAKADRRVLEQSIETEAMELNLGYQLTRRWDVSAGVRQDSLTDNAPLIAATQQQGERTDAVVQLGYDSQDAWSAYGFVQDTVAQDGDRPENGRVGVGGSVRISDRMTLDSELSTGDLGAGGKVGTSYMHSERTRVYLTYALENERYSPVTQAFGGSEGNLVSGVKTRLSDSTSVYAESRYRHGTNAMGLTYATGVDFKTAERWSFGASSDIGTLQDLRTGAETDRKAIGARVGYGSDRWQLSSGVEYRADDTEQPDLSTNDRKTWLFRNNLKFQMTPSARLLGKVNHAQSESSLGDFYAGGYTEAVLGYAYRPVMHDRLNTLVKYTYFYNIPTTDQLSLKGVAAEFIQKSHVASIDVDYDLTSRWSIGGKYAYRLGELSLDRDNPDFFANTASLYVLRTDWRFLEHWSLLMETRLLEMHDLEERKQGVLFSVSRDIGDHYRVGLGYNFTDFSSDLTDLSYDHQGLFLNLTAAL